MDPSLNKIIRARTILALVGLVGLLFETGCTRAQAGSPSDGADGALTPVSPKVQLSTGVDREAISTPERPSAEEPAPVLQPSADCTHPPVREQCQGAYCRVEAGCFIMGSPPSEFGRALVAEDQVQVTLTHSFLMGRTEVTRAQWKRSGLPIPKLARLNGSRECLDADCPQGNATFYDMLRYANRLSEMEHLKPCYLFEGTSCTGSIQTKDFECPEILVSAESPYECEGYRLPMEAEWEYAARAGSKTAFASGEITATPGSSDCAPDAALDIIGWFCGNSPEQTQRVATKQPNGFGLHDMHGNALELVNDLYGPSGYGLAEAGGNEGPLVNPTGAANGAKKLTKTKERPFRVARGGAHNLPAVNAKSSRRLGGIADSDAASNIGFRVVRTLR